MKAVNKLKKLANVKNYFCRFFLSTNLYIFFFFAIYLKFYLNFRDRVPEERCSLPNFSKLEEIYSSTRAAKKQDINFIISVSFAILNGRINSVTYGANEGNSVDDVLWIFRDVSAQSKFILLEPVPHIFEKLRKNYAGIKSAIFVNSAICPKEQSTARLHTIDFSSFKCGRILKASIVG